MKTPLILTPKQINAEIKRRNTAFKAASAAQKRVLLAQDVIDQIKSERFEAQTGAWVHLDERFDTYDRLEGSASVQKAMLDGSIEHCTVCALGGLMASCVLFKNKVTMSDVNKRHALDFAAMSWVTNQTRITEKVGLRKHFSMTQLKLIELAFEGEDGYFGNEMGMDEPSKLEAKAIAWCGRTLDDRDLLLSIMHNIVENDGTFVP